MVLQPTMQTVSVDQNTVLLVCYVLFYRAKRMLVLFIHHAANKMVLPQTTKIANAALSHVIQLNQFVENHMDTHSVKVAVIVVTMPFQT